MIAMTTTDKTWANPAESCAEFDDAIRKIKALFDHNEWTWSSEIPTRHEIEWRVLDAIHNTIIRAERDSKDYASVSFGRINVEIRKSGPCDEPTWAIMLGMSFTV